MSYVPRLRELYKSEIAPKLKEDFGYSSVMQIPRITKVCLNRGIGDATADKKIVEEALDEMSRIAGQKAVPTKAKKSISNFKLREGMVIGVRTTLRGDKMYEFLDRLISVALPRVRDFQGVKDKSFDGRGNYTLGITEQIIFPEINMDKVNTISGLDITIVTTAQTDNEAYTLLKHMGVPFVNRNN
ncbi:MAG TPA: 50S ribosomal protein L5 [Saprospiraceae bacterium]|nr:50S ribosomal protein L5 [Saprospiraceae bacterium]